MISKYKNFILEKALNESTLYVSPQILKRLQKIDSNISKDLIAQLGKDIKPDATFLDESDKEGELTFVTMRNAIKRLSDIYGDDDFVKSLNEPSVDTFAIDISNMLKNNEPNFWVQSRNPIKIGRFIRQVFPGKYSDVDIEKFVNEFKSSDEKDLQKFILVEGEDIETYYWHENYKEMAGDLGRSCMARKKKYFNIYTQNPEVCRLLVLLEADKVIGRSLIWKLEKNNVDDNIEYFMDRQYTIEQSDVVKFTNYAKENGWAYKTYNNHHSYSNITYSGKEMNCEMVVKLVQKSFDSYPYMDTFKRFDPATGELFNDMEKDDHEGQYILDDTDGDYTEISSGRWSDYYDTEIPEDEAVWSEAYGDWLPENRAIHIESRRNRTSGWFPEDDDNIYYSEWEDEYLHLDDCVYSDDKDEYIYEPNAVLGAYEINEEGGIETSWYHDSDDDCIEIDKTMRWYEILSEKNSDWEDVSRMNLKITDRWSTVYKEFYPKIFKVFLYRMKNSEDKIYLSVRDAKILGFEYDKEDKIEIDDFEYHKRLNEAYVNDVSLFDTLTTKLENDLIPNTERIADEGEEDMKQMYVDRLQRAWDKMGYDK